MGILDNLENSWDFEFQSKPMPVTDNMGREEFWKDAGRPENDSFALEMFKEECCNTCNCYDTEFQQDELDLNI